MDGFSSLAEGDGHAYRTNDPSQHAALMAAIGYVAHESAQLSHQLVQLAETISGTGLTYVLLENGPLGSQVSKILEMVKRLNTSEWLAHRTVKPRDAQAASEVLQHVKYLVELRNRLIHDVWYVYPITDCPDAIEGYPPTRWAQRTIHSSIRTVHIVYGLLGVAAAAISDIEVRIGSNRPEVDPGNVDRLAKLVVDVKANKNPAWRWIASSEKDLGE